MQTEGQMSLFDLDSPFGRMCPEPSAATKGMTSRQSSKPFVKSGGASTILYLCLQTGGGNPLGASWETVGALPGVYMTLNTGEFPSEGRESTLSQILQANVPEKYYLSPKACAGILRRAEKRGKELPPMLKEALEEVISLSDATSTTDR